MSSWIQGCCLLFILLIQNIGIAQTVIPETLQPWKEWVLRGQKEHLCPRPYHLENSFFCHWPSEVNFIVKNTGAHFKQKGILYQASWVMLAGDSRHWPDEVKNNHQPIPVVAREGRPFVFLEKGSYDIEGKFTWLHIPERIAIPSSSGLVHVSINEKQINTFDRDKNGYVWLRKSSEDIIPTTEENSIQLRVYRKLQDSIPQEILTLLKLSVAGKEREITIGPVISKQQEPISIHTPLPVRLTADNALEIQVKPGTWDIYLNSRYLTQHDQFSYLPTKFGPEEEIWSFEAQPQYRQVEVTGPLSVDPIQAGVPQSWQQFPAYLMKDGVLLKIDEKQRGKLFERGEQLALARTIWLDFDGKGMTVEDKLTGTIEDQWRLSVQPPLALGRVMINNEAQLITTLANDQDPGVEIRNGRLNLVAISRIEQYLQKIPAIGWNRDLNQLQTVLHLPPGWKLLNVLGVDQVSNAWVKNWNLLDLFLVLLISLSVAKLFSWQYGIFALLTVGLIYQEPMSPIYSWLAVLAGLGLLRVVPDGNAKRWVKAYSFSACLLLVMLAVPFIGAQIQTAFYPQLNKPDVDSRAHIGFVSERATDLDTFVSNAPQQAIEAARSSVQQLKSLSPNRTNQIEKQLQDYDPDAKIQTGPGIPNWRWNRIELKWNGPVSQEQNIHLWVLPAWAVSFLKLAQVFLVIGMLVLLIRALHPFFRGGLMNKKNYPATSKNILSFIFLPLILVFLNIGTVKTAYADIPNTHLLNELKDYLLTPPECMPHCADYNKAQFIIDNELMTLRIGIQAIENVAVPLPNNDKGWLIKNILLNGEPVKAVKQDKQGILWVYVDKGEHEFIITGTLTPIRVFDLSFRLLPKFISVVNNSNNTWSVTGISNENQLTGTSLQFSYMTPSEQANGARQDVFKPIEIPPFVEFKRTLRLGLEWEIDNELRRISPAEEALHITLPLIKNEKILSSQVKVKDNQLQVQLAKGQQHLRWQSTLDIAPNIELQATSSSMVKEVWQLQALPMWHVDFMGVPVIHQQNRMGQWLPEWHPWPTERLEMLVTKPQALAGNTLTINNSRYSFKPGKRKTEHTLSLNLTSSQGGQHTLTLPESIKIQDVKIQNLSQPIQLEGNQLTIPIYPGIQDVLVTWESSTALKIKTMTPVLSIANSSTNHITEINVGHDRWILWLGGPEIGPVILYWAVLCLTLIISVVLGASGLTPLATWQWLLLGLGVTLTTPFAALVIVAWFMALHFREKLVVHMNVKGFQIYQVFIVLLTVVFVISLFICITNGLLGNPQMQLLAPKTDLVHSQLSRSFYYVLQWYQDQVSNHLPISWVLSIPLLAYRTLMLLWALWLAFSLLKWFQWAWQCFAKDGIWRKKSEVLM